MIVRTHQQGGELAFVRTIEESSGNGWALPSIEYNLFVGNDFQ